MEIIELGSFGQGGLPGVFSQIRSQLAPADAEQIEVFPIEFAGMAGPGQHHHPDHPVEMQQRNQCPGFGLGQQPFGQRMRRIRGGAQLVEIGDEPIVLESPRLGCLKRHRGHVGSWPLPPRCQRQFAAITAGEQQAGRAFRDIRQGSDHALAQRRAIGSDLANRAVEPQPFGAIIVAVLEQVLDDRHPQPAPQPLRGRQGQRSDRGDHDKADLQQYGIVASSKSKPLRRRHHRDQIGADQPERDRLEGDRARWLKAQLFAPLGCPQHQQARNRNAKQPAQHVSDLRNVIGQECNGIVIKIDDPQQSQ